MPKGLKRYYGAGDLHFITCSCYQRKLWLDTGERRDLFLRVLKEVRQEQRFIVLGYVVMPELFHLLMNEPQMGTPSTAMQSVKQRFARESYQGADNGGAPLLAAFARGGKQSSQNDAHLAATLLRFQCLDRAQAD